MLNANNVETELQTESKSKKKRGPNREYFKIKEYQSYLEASLDMKTLKIRGHSLGFKERKPLKETV